MTIKQLYHLNRHHVPGRAMTIDMVLNICFVLLIGNLFGVLAASNIGYVLAHFFAITGFILLRRDRPNWPRPINLAPVWVPIAYVLAGGRPMLTIVGVGWFQNAAGGYGGTKEKVIGFSVLAISILLLFFVRRLVQDGSRSALARGHAGGSVGRRAGGDRRGAEGRDLSRAWRSGTRAAGSRTGPLIRCRSIGTVRERSRDRHDTRGPTWPRRASRQHA